MPLFRLVEQKVKFSVRTSENPWALQDCNADIRPPVGSRYESFLSLAMFFDGRSQNTDTYAFRFVPDCPGSWNWTLNCSKLVLAPGEPSSGTVEAASSVHDGRGGVLRATKNPQFLEREDGSRWTPIGFVCNKIIQAFMSMIFVFCWIGFWVRSPSEEQQKLTNLSFEIT